MQHSAVLMSATVPLTCSTTITPTHVPRKGIHPMTLVVG
jgi:hypothetical protein